MYCIYYVITQIIHGSHLHRLSHDTTTIQAV